MDTSKTLLPFFRKGFFSKTARIQLCVLAVLFTVTRAIAADYYWVGGTGNWSELNHWATTSGGAVKHVQVPTAFDDVYFDDNSFTSPGQSVSVNAGNYACRKMDWSSALYTPEFNCITSFSLRIYGSLTLTPYMLFNYNGPIFFEATGGSHSIDMAGHSLLKHIYFNGAGGEWTLLSALDLGGNSLILVNGSLITNGVTINCGTFYSAYNTVRKLDISHSVINTNTWSLGAENLVFVSGLSTINLTGTNSSMSHSGGLLAYHDIYFTNTLGLVNFNCSSGTHVITKTLEFRNNAKIYGNVTASDLKLLSNYYELRPHDTLSVLISLTAQGSCSSPLMIFSGNDSLPALIRPPAANTTLQYILFKNIIALPVNGFICNAQYSIGLGSTSGWMISPPASHDLYWVGGSGNWDDPQHWSLQSNGPGGSCIPSAFDNVHFDQHSFTAAGQSITINIEKAFCRNMDWTGVLFSPVLCGPATNALHLYGSLSFSPAMQNTFAGVTSFEAQNGLQTITSAGQVFNGSVIFNGAGGSWILQDDFNTGYNTVTLRNGSFITNSMAVTCGKFQSGYSTQRALSLGSSIFDINGTGNTAWNLCAANLTFDAGTSILNFNSVTGGMQSSNGDTISYHYVNFTHNNGISKINSANITAEFKMAKFSNNGFICGNNIFDSLYLDNTNYTLGAGCTQTILSYFGNSASCVHYMNLMSSSEGSAAFIHKTGGIISLDYIMARDIQTGGGASFMANNSVDLGNNSGWNFSSPAPADLYWVGGGGNWHDPMHWSFASGGSGGACTPTPFDNVHFDSLSFTGHNQCITITATDAYCKNFTWTAPQFTPRFNGSNSTTLHLYGNLNLAPDMAFDFGGTICMRGDSPSGVINTAGHELRCELVLSGSGGWSLADDLRSFKGLQISKGTFHSQNFSINCQRIASNQTHPRSLDLGSSEINLTANNNAALSLQSNSLNLNAGASTIRFSAPMGGMSCSGAGTLNFNVVLFEDSTGCQEIKTQNTGNTFRKVVFRGNGIINGNNTFDTLTFFPSKTYTLQSSMTQTILSKIDLSGNGCFPITLQSSVSGQPSYIYKSSGNVLAAYVEMRDQSATGGASFLAGEHCIDVAGNSGWIFNAQPGYYYGLPDTMGLCPGSTLVINTYNFTGGISFTWQDGTDTSLYPVSQPGKYWLTVTFADQCYYIDTVNVVHLPQPFAYAGADTTICAGAIACLLAHGAAGATYLWSDNTGDQLNCVSPQQTTTYAVSATTSCGFATDDVTVNVIPLPWVNAGSDLTICSPGDPVMLTAAGEGSVLWSSGDEQLQITIAPMETSTYTVTATNSCGSASDEITVYLFNPVIDITVQDEICNMSNGTLSLQGWQSYQWSNGSVSPVIAGLTAGLYTVTVSDGQCSASAEAVVNAIAGPRAAFSADADNTAPGQYRLQCHDRSEGAIFWHWNFGDSFSSGLQNPAHYYEDAGDYQVMLVVFDQNQCSDTAIQKISFYESGIFYMPSSFTPNGDALNDVFGPVWIHEDWVKQYSFSIFDRWGGIIFSAGDTRATWDGRHQSDRNKVQQDTYTWIIELTDINGKEYLHTGSVFVFHNPNRMTAGN